MSIVAVIPVANMGAANASLGALGFGPRNFSVPAYAASATTPAFAALHAWSDGGFATAVKALAGVQWEQSSGDPIARTKALIEAQGARWGAQAPALSGQLQANRLYRHSDDSLWWTLQAYDAGVFNQHPSTYPALIRRVRTPGAYEPWVQSLGAGYEYKLLDLFTGQPERCSHSGQRWVTTVDNNVWEPGVYGWQVQA